MPFEYANTQIFIAFTILPTSTVLILTVLVLVKGISWYGMRPFSLNQAFAHSQVKPFFLCQIISSRRHLILLRPTKVGQGSNHWRNQILRIHLDQRPSREHRHWNLIPASKPAADVPPASCLPT